MTTCKSSSSTMDLVSAKRILRKRKQTYKRRLIVFIWAAFITYFSFVPSSDSKSVSVTLQEFSDTSNVQQANFASMSNNLQSLSRSIRSLVGDSSNNTAYNIDDLISDYDEIGDLIEGINCTPPAIADFPRDLFSQEQRANGAVIVHFLASLYIFYSVALVCDDFFVPSIECICEDLHLPSDVGGATFMAIATSAPELFTNVVGTFITKGDIGIGTIVGSAVFNILAVGACCGLAANKALPLEWWPLTRDCLFYSLSVVFLIIVQLNRQVYWYESLGLVLFYCVYIGVMYKNASIKAAVEGFVHKFTHKRKHKVVGGKNSLSIRGVSPSKVHGDETTPLLTEKHVKSGGGGALPDFDVNFTSPSIYSSAGYQQQDKKIHEEEEEEEVSPLENSGIPGGYSEDGEADENDVVNEDDDDDYNGNDERRQRKMSVEEYDELLISQALQKSVAHAKEEQEEGGLFILPRGAGIIEWFEYIVGWPVRFCLTITMPDCRQQRWRHWYPLTFIVCILWIGGLSYIVSWMMTVIGHTLHIPDSVMGLTFIAAGTSVPEAVSSIIVARQGLGSMGISNSIGSNTFDILICLGLPWLIRGSLIAQETENYILINSGGLGYSTIMLMVSLFFLYFLLACNGFILDKRVGLISLLMYGIFLVTASLMELNVFFPSANLPACPTDL